MKIHIRISTCAACLAFSLLFVLIPARSRASIVSEQCEVCHSLFPAISDKDLTEDQVYAIRNSHCVNCHSSTGGGTVKVLAGVNVPVVYNIDVPGGMLAGGNFHYVAQREGDRKGHNVEGIAPEDRKYGTEPPGYERAMDRSKAGYDLDKPLACAGANGCHGDRNVRDPFEAVMGAHHGVDSPVNGKTTAKSFRYLKNTALVNGVTGLEDEDWENTVSPKDHNEYSPDINEFCTGCHGDLHVSSAGGPSPWFRHPTGVVLPKRGEYLGYETYSPDAPVAREKVPALPSDEVTPGSDIVICLSCHRAHSSPYAHSLRWDYDAIFVGEGEGGCFICHTSKNGK
jgi:hypothetical protein